MSLYSQVNLARERRRMKEIGEREEGRGVGEKRKRTEGEERGKRGERRI